MKIPQAEVQPRVRQAIEEQLEIISCHLKGPGPVEPSFLREHAMLVAQLAEVLMEPGPKQPQ